MEVVNSEKLFVNEKASMNLKYTLFFKICLVEYLFEIKQIVFFFFSSKTLLILNLGFFQEEACNLFYNYAIFKTAPFFLFHILFIQILTL